MLNRSALASVLILLIIGCKEEYDLHLDSIKPKLVVEANITNQNGPYLIRLTKSRSQLTFNPYNLPDGDTVWNYNNDFAEAVMDAEIYIEDNTEAIVDTLVKCPAGNWIHIDDTIHNYHNSYFEVADPSILLGYYKTTKLKGIAGHTYTMTIKWQGKEYHSTSYLPPVTNIDSVHFNLTIGDVGKEDYNIPLLYFKEPQNERNYYLFITLGHNFVWPYSVLSDEFLGPYVNGLDVCRGISPEYWMTAYPDVNTDYYFIEMHSLTKEGYEYYKALLQQFVADGGAYSPTPATPPGNIDNGALGFFKASSVNRVEFIKENK
jgi:hypothetical protein